MTDAERLWTTGAAALRTQISDATWKAWFEGITPVDSADGRLVLAVPNALVKERIEGRYLGLVRDVVADANTAFGPSGGTDLAIDIVVRTDARSSDPGQGAGTGEEGDSGSPVLSGTTEVMTRGTAPSRRSGTEPAPGGREGDLPLNPRYGFDGFVIGASNRFAHAAALSVAENPGKSYNPLFIHGAAGLGKTHLLHSIGNYVRENFPARRVRYVSTETYMNEFVEAIRANAMAVFKRRYRECDVLLLDDVQFMERKEQLQEEFFHNFNSLYNANKQIVMTSDRPPKSIATLEDRLRSRFLSGLTTDVQPPELETRLAILRKKAEGERAHVPDDVLEFIASNVKDNIRELEGALIRVSAFASLNRQPMNRELAEHVLSDMLATRQPRQITPQIILDATAETFGFNVDELRGPNRRRPLVQARQVGMYVFRTLTDYSYPAIAREFGGRDHTTVIHAVEKISGLMKERRQIFDQVTALMARIKSGD